MRPRLLPPPRQYPVWVHEPRNLRMVDSGLYVGGERAQLVSRRAFTNAEDDDARFFTYAVQIDLHGGSVSLGERTRFLCYPVFDGQPLPPRLLDVAWMLAGDYGPRRPVLVQCQAGLSRSASVAYALMRKRHGKKIAHEEALRRVQVPHYEGVFPMQVLVDSVREWLAIR